jgi:predicted enzyme related to lactoylglutathione lyase
MSQNIRVSTLIIGVKDLNKSRPFYENVLGIEILDFRPPFMEGKLGDIEFNIEENADYRDSDWAEKNIGGRKSFTLEVNDIFNFIENAKANGVTVVHEPKKQAWGWYDAVISDIDGNEFVIEQEV